MRNRRLLSLCMVLGLVPVACDDPGQGGLDEDPWVEATLDDSGSEEGEPAWGEPVSLVKAEAWSPAAAAHDPLADERPAEVECPSAAWGPELGGLEIQTGVCNYFFATQPSRVAIEPGDAIEVVVMHAGLDASEPAEGHVAVLLGDAVAWEQWVAIPTDAAVFEATVTADRAWPAGTPVGLHLHNHGYNAWTVLGVSVAAAE